MNNFKKVGHGTGPARLGSQYIIDDDYLPRSGRSSLYNSKNTYSESNLLTRQAYTTTHTKLTRFEPPITHL